MLHELNTSHKAINICTLCIQVVSDLYIVNSSVCVQVGTSGRSEKIRTYNFPQDRVTDHRVGISLHHIQTLLTGGEELHDLMEHLQGEGQKESLIEVLERWEKDKERDSK